MRRMTWGAKLFLLCISIVLGGALALLANTAMAETNTISSTVTGTTTVDKTPSTASAPSVIINNQDVCTSGTSVAIQTQILGFATGQTITDENCERLKLARSLYGMGMKVAAVSVLCQDKRVWDGMWMAGTPCPYLGKIGKAATEAWESSDYNPPELVTSKKGNEKPYLKPKETEEVVDVKPDDKTVFGLFGIAAALLFLL